MVLMGKLLSSSGKKSNMVHNSFADNQNIMNFKSGLQQNVSIKLRVFKTSP